MNFAEPFIRRPVATTLLVLSILTFGVMGYRLLPVNDLPTVDFPTIQVSASLPGASPETMAATVVPEGQSRRFPGPVPHAEFAHSAPVAARSVRAEPPRAAPLDGHRRGAG